MAAIDADAGLGDSWRRDSTEERGRRARRAQYIAEALREQQEEGRRVQEAYRRTQQSSGGGAEKDRRHTGEARRHAGTGHGDTGKERGYADTGAGPHDGGRAGQHAGGSAGPHAEEERARSRRYRGKSVADYYEVLEVSPRARQAVIEKAYRTLMREDHPDQGGDPRRAQLVNEAYEILGDPVKRREYDQENGLGRPGGR